MWNYVPEIMDALLGLIISLVRGFNTFLLLLTGFLGNVCWLYFSLVYCILCQATSNGKYVDPCLDMLIKNFIPPYSFLRWLKQPRGLSIKEQVLSRVHSALESISRLVPLAPMRLLPLVVQRMPRQNDKENVSFLFILFFYHKNSWKRCVLLCKRSLCIYFLKNFAFSQSANWVILRSDK